MTLYVWRPIVIATAMLVAPTSAHPWGFKGHQIVGEIADQIIARDHPALQERLKDMLPAGKALSDVAVYPDCLLFSCNVVQPGFFDSFIKRNPESDKYHFTDVPIQRKRYAANTAGTHRHDVVQILRYAVGRLRGLPPTDVPADFDENEAIWVMTHLVGDIHQPLHVGSRYYDDKCLNVVDPNVDGGAGLPDFGIGTKFSETHGGGWFKIPPNRQLHKIWDNEAVEGAMRLANVHDGSIKKFAEAVLANPPTGWKTSGDVSTWSRRWADEILPLAREAHERIKVTVPGVDQQASHDKVECRWEATLQGNYDDWAAEKVREQLAKAGFRLAEMLRVLLDD
jgi:S1/P1 Nuclease